MPKKLYKIYSYVQNFKTLGEVCLEWAYHLRKAPVAPYQDMINGYNDLTERDQEYACRRVDQMFTDEETAALASHLEQVHRIESFTIEKPLPLDIADMEDRRVSPRDLWKPGDILEFSKGPKYDLPFEVQAYCNIRTNPIRNDKDLVGLISKARERIDVLVEKVFSGLPGLVTGIHCYILDCGCVALRQKFEDGSLNNEVEVHHDPDRGPCDVCMEMKIHWKNRVIDEVVVYNSRIQID